MLLACTQAASLPTAAGTTYKYEGLARERPPFAPGGFGGPQRGGTRNESLRFDAALFQSSGRSDRSDRKHAPLLLTPKREIQVQVAIERDNGEIATLLGYRVQHDECPRPDEGGPALSSRRRSGRSPLAGRADDLEDRRRQYPLRRRQGGHRRRSRAASATRELELITRKFVDGIHDLIGPDIDIPAPDMGTNAEVMAWFMNQYAKYHGFSPACVTGKPVELHGLPGREEATGRGVGIFTFKLLSRTGSQAGRHARRDPRLRQRRLARRQVSRRSRIPASWPSATSAAATISPKGSTFRPCCASTANTRAAWPAIPKPSQSSNEELLALDVDVLIPAALGGVITNENADTIRARIIIEAANAPIDPDADDILAERGVVILPDILANAGGVTASYFEWVQNRQHYQWDLNRVRQELDHVLVATLRARLGDCRRAKSEPAHGGLHRRHRPRRPGHRVGRNCLNASPLSLLRERAG